MRHNVAILLTRVAAPFDGTRSSSASRSAGTALAGTVKRHVNNLWTASVDHPVVDELAGTVGRLCRSAEISIEARFVETELTGVNRPPTNSGKQSIAALIVASSGRWACVTGTGSLSRFVGDKCGGARNRFVVIGSSSTAIFSVRSRAGLPIVWGSTVLR